MSLPHPLSPGNMITMLVMEYLGYQTGCWMVLGLLAGAGALSLVLEVLIRGGTCCSAQTSGYSSFEVKAEVLVGTLSDSV